MRTRDAHLKVVVASLTRGRPRMLAELIRSWGQMDLPENCDVRFLIVENDSQPASRGVVEAAEPLGNGARIDYVLETEPGIPFGRNRAAREAIAQGADLLAFVDDDETVARDWLVRMIDGYRRSEAVLLGAPLRIDPSVEGLSFWERLMHDNVGARYRKKEERAAARATLHATNGTTIVTNNWLGETSLFSREGIWFDEATRYSGGEDSKFYDEVRQKDFRTGWVKDAYVYETVPKARLTFGYQYGRARDQAITHFVRKIEEQPTKRWGLLVSVPAKMVGALILAVALPLTRGGTLLEFARTAGWIAGRLGALMGRRSKHYFNTTGH
ncbi:glycosyltransferase family 2 protein [Sedimentimonas flavescens]|nr:glycosyltransferase family 2 protein [Sedimentimonas flavescens]